MRPRPNALALAALACALAGGPSARAAGPVLREYPSIAMGEDGTVITWVERHAASAEVVAAWTSIDAPAVSVSGPIASDALIRPHVALRGTRAVITWADPSRGDHDVWAAISDDGGLSFAPPVLAAGGPGGQLDPRAAVLPGGRIAISFHDSFGSTAADEGLVWRTRVVVSDGAGRFGPSVVVSGPASSSAFDLYAAIAGLGTPTTPLVVAWLREGTSTSATELHVASSTDGGETFDAPRRIDRPLGRHLYPRVAATSSGWIAAYPSLLPAGDTQGSSDVLLAESAYLDVLAVTSTTSGATIGAPLLTPASGRLTQHQVDVAADGQNVALVWIDHALPDHRRVAYAWSHDGGQTFGPALEVPGTSGRDVAHPSVSVRGDEARVTYELAVEGGTDVQVAQIF